MHFHIPMRFLLVRAVWVFLGCFVLSPGAAHASDPLPVIVSILPQKRFVERIGGDRVSVQTMVSPGASPATYEPKPRQMAGIASARLFFAVGVPFESVWLDRIAAANPEMEIVRTQDGIEKRVMAAHRHPDDEEMENGHGHGNGAEEHDPSHRGHDEEPSVDGSDSRANGGRGHGDDGAGIRDPHIWLSPPLVMQQARAIARALIAADPAGRSDYESRYRKFVAEVVDLDLELMELFSMRKERGRFLVYHPSWGYFADAYGLTQIPVELEGKEPKPAQLRELIERARREGARAVFVQPQFSRRSAETVAKAIGGDVVEVDPLAENWAENLRSAAKRFAAAAR